MLPLRVRVNLGVMAMKWCTIFPKAPGLEPYLHIKDTRCGWMGECYLSAELQLVYSTAAADWAIGDSLGESYPSAEKQSVYSTDRLYQCFYKSTSSEKSGHKRVLPQYLVLFRPRTYTCSLVPD